MNAPPSIADCEACRDALTELVCDELDAETRRAVIAHTQTCPSCAAELVKMRAVLQVAEAIPLEAPSARVHAAVMLAAREANVRRSAIAKAPQRETAGAFEIIRAWLTQVGTWAMSPQVAMASVLLLMLGVGLVALPLGEDREQPALRAAQEAEEPQPATASGAVAPAAPIALSEPAAEAEQDKSADPTAAERRATPEVGLYEKAASQTKPATRRREAARAADESLSAEKQAPKKEVAFKDQLSLDDGADDRAKGDGADPLAGLGAVSGGSARGKSSANQATQAFPALEQETTLRERRSARSQADFASAPPQPAATAPSPAPEPSGASSFEGAAEAKKSAGGLESQLLAQGVAAARARDYATAIPLLRPLADKGSASVRKEAALWLARSYRATNNCSAALRLYAPLVQASKASEALLAEAIDCYERTGNAQQAALLRSRVQPANATKSAPVDAVAKPKQ